MNEFMWPCTLEELNIEDGTDQIRPEHIASYAYPPGRRLRYTEEGWEIAKRRGFASNDVREHGAIGDADAGGKHE